jgi:hypothetical protein
MLGVSHESPWIFWYHQRNRLAGFSPGRPSVRPVSKYCGLAIRAGGMGPGELLETLKFQVEVIPGRYSGPRLTVGPTLYSKPGSEKTNIKSNEQMSLFQINVEFMA